MTIFSQDIKFFKSQKMSDVPDGGGAMSLAVIESGVENEIFDDVSDVNRAAGNLSIRKVFATNRSENNEKFLDTGVVIIREPEDINTSVLLHKTGDFYDVRGQFKNAIENYLGRGTVTNWMMFGDQYIGSKMLSLFSGEDERLPVHGTVWELISWTDTTRNVITHSEFVRVIRVISSSVNEFYDAAGIFTRNVIVVELNKPIKNLYKGTKIVRVQNLVYSAAVLSTRVIDSAEYYGTKKMREKASDGDSAVYVFGGMLHQLIPASRVSIPHIDVFIPRARAIIKTADELTTITNTAPWSAGTVLRLGMAIYPGSLSINSTYTDNKGDLVKSGAIKGMVGYADGIITVNEAIAGNKDITFYPASSIKLPVQSLVINITNTTQYTAYVAILVPKPEMGSVMVDYQHRGQWYRLTDNGGGTLIGDSPEAGTGTANYLTGQISVSLGALPDVESVVIFSFVSGGGAQLPPEAKKDLQFDPIAFFTTQDADISFDPSVNMNYVNFTADNLSVQFKDADSGSYIAATGAISNGSCDLTADSQLAFIVNYNLLQQGITLDAELYFKKLPKKGDKIKVSGNIKGGYVPNPVASIITVSAVIDSEDLENTAIIGTTTLVNESASVTITAAQSGSNVLSTSTLVLMDGTFNCVADLSAAEPGSVAITAAVNDSAGYLISEDYYGSIAGAGGGDPGGDDPLPPPAEGKEWIHGITPTILSTLNFLGVDYALKASLGEMEMRGEIVYEPSEDRHYAVFAGTIEYIKVRFNETSFPGSPPISEDKVQIPFIHKAPAASLNYSPIMKVNVVFEAGKKIREEATSIQTQYYNGHTENYGTRYATYTNDGLPTTRISGYKAPNSSAKHDLVYGTTTVSVFAEFIKPSTTASFLITRVY